MLKLLKYILLITFLLVAPAAARSGSVIDTVCKDAVRTYRVDGEPGLIYNWTLTDTSGSPVLSSPGVVVSNGSEITITWAVTPGIFTLSVEKISLFGCPKDTLGTIEVIPVPVVDPGPDQTICAGKTVSLIDATAINLTPAGLEWTSAGDGSFNDPLIMKPVYTPGPKDIKAGTVKLKLTAKSMNKDDGCQQEKETEITIIPQSKLLITNPPDACTPGTVNLKLPAVTKGSTVPPAATFSYWEDALTTVALANPNAVSKTGTYYIRLDVNGLCPDIQPVKVVVNVPPVLVIHDPQPVCYPPATVDLSDPAVTAGSDLLATFSYWTDDQATKPLLNYKTVNTSGIYYIAAASAAGCPNIQPVTVVVIQKVMPQFILKNELCLNSAPLPLPSFSDNAIAITGSWNPSTISTSTNGTTNYVFTPDPGQCAYPYSIPITVSDHFHSKFAPIGPFCVGSSPSLPASSNGITGNWNPSTISTVSGGDATYKFTPDDPAQCALDTTITIHINDKVTPIFTINGSICQNGANPLPSSTNFPIPITGTWSPAFSSATPGPTTYTFTPNSGECANPATMVVTVQPEVIPVFTPVGPFCANDLAPVLPTVSDNGITGFWSPAAVDMTNSGTYTFIPDAGQCASPVLTKMDIVINRIDVVATPTQITKTNPTGSIVLAVSNGSGTYTYLWTGPAGFTSTDRDISGLSLGNYTVVVTDMVTNCTQPKTVNIHFVDILSVDISSTLINCPGGNDGTATVVISGGTPPYSVLWSTGTVAVPVPGNIATIGGLSLNDFFYADVNDAVGNTFRTPFEPIKETTIRYTFASYVPHPPVCAGDKGKIDFIFGNGGIIPNSNYDILYDGGQFTGIPIIGNKASVDAFAGTYNNLRIVVNGCTTPFFGPVILTEPTLTVTTSILQPTCSVITGAITVSSPAPGVGINYTLTGTNPIVAPQTKPSGLFDKLSPGEYGLTIQNGLGCISKPTPLTIDLPPSAIIPVAVPTQPKCIPDKGTIVVTNPSGAAYEFSKDGGISYQDSPTFTNLDAATYSVKAREKGTLCETGITLVKIDPASSLPDLATVSITQPSCEVPTGSFTITNLAFDSGYEYSLDGINYQDSKNFSGLTPGQLYQLMVRLKSTGCESVSSVKIDAVPSLQAAPIATVKQPDCVDEYGIVTVIDPPFNSGFEYSLNAGVSYQDSAIFRKLNPGTYQLVARKKGEKCPTAIRQLGIGQVPPNPDPPAIALNPLFDCEESPVQTLDANNGIVVETGTSISWYDQPSGGNKVLSPILNKVGNATYYAESKRGNCVSSTRTGITLTIYPTPLIFGPASLIEQCETIPIQLLDASSYITGLKPGEKLVWFDAATGGNIASPILNTIGNKTVYAEATNNKCKSASRVPVTLIIDPIPLAPVWVSNGKLTDCEMSPIQTLDANTAIIAVPGTMITWYDQALGGTVIPSPTLNKPGTVTWYAEASIGTCINPTRTPVQLTISPIPAAPVWVKNITECETSPIQTLDAVNGIAAPLPGTSIKWYDLAVGGTLVASPTLNAVGTKTYYAEATIGNCVSTKRTAVILTINPSPEILVSRNPVEECAQSPLQKLDANNYVTVDPGISLIWYDAATGVTKVAKPVLNKVGTVTYYAETSNGICSSPARTGITLSIFAIPEQPVDSITNPPSCKNEMGTINILKPLGQEYEYSADGGIYQTSITFSNLKSGPHLLTARNISTHCESVSGTVILPPVPPAPIMKSATVTDCKCFGEDGSIDFEFANVTDGTYVIVYVSADNLPGKFLNVQVTKNKATVLAKAGTYNILAIEANGCTSAEQHSVTILQPDRISTSGVITEIDLKSGTKGAIDLTITGGTGPGTYLTVWQPNTSNGFAGATTEDIKNLDAGDYSAMITDKNGCKVPFAATIPLPNLPPVATPDDFSTNCSDIPGNLVYNDNGHGIDSDPENDPLTIDTTPIAFPLHGKVTINSDGSFTYTAVAGFIGKDSFKYRIFDSMGNASIPALVSIELVADFDHDGIPDDVDADADGDGILNVDEVLPGQDWKTTDTDGDGHPNWLDIDSDNDGIVDNVEAQNGKGVFSSEDPGKPEYIAPSGKVNSLGVDLAYDPAAGGTKIVPVDTDGDGVPDFLDSDSDNDHVPDYIEGHDLDADGKPDHILTGKDADGDGLDDGYDTILNSCGITDNAIGSNAELQDFDRDGLRDWRDDNDDGDKYLTRFEDLNMDGDYSNDDIGHVGHPEYLWVGRDCDIFIPDAFSPNDDNIHDYFEIYCTEKYPNAKIYIFDQLGNLLYEKDHYGNVEYWNSPEDAWWDGRTKNRSAKVINGKVIPGTYFYVLKLGNGEVKKSFVFVSY